jgi:hypothetical protein
MLKFHFIQESSLMRLSFRGRLRYASPILKFPPRARTNSSASSVPVECFSWFSFLSNAKSRRGHGKCLGKWAAAGTDLFFNNFMSKAHTRKKMHAQMLMKIENFFLSDCLSLPNKFSNHIKMIRDSKILLFV